MSAGECRRALAALLATAAGFLALPGASASADQAEALFDPSKMYVINLTLPPESITGLNNDSNTYQPGTFSIAESSDGTPAGVGASSSPVDVEVRLKGNFSWRPLSGKAAFKVRFPKAQLFNGLRVLTLNNMVSDASMIHETLAYTAYRGAGVPASRTGYAYVYVNGIDYGIHLNIETMDRIALEKLFGPFDEDVQHLYEGEDGDDVWPDFAWSFEVDEGDDGDLSDLEEFADVANASGSQPWAEQVEPFADLEQMTTMWAAEKYVGQWDGYSGQEESWTPNNYYLYSDASGRFKMLPWGNDETWELAHRLPFSGPAGRLFDLCLKDAACESIYRQSATELYDAVPGMSLDELAVESAALLAPWQELEEEQSTRGEHSPEEAADGVAEALEFIAGRQAELAVWLGLGPNPQPDPARITTPGEEQVPAVIPAALRVERVLVHEGVLFTRLTVPGPGKIKKQVKVHTAKGTLIACRTRRDVRHAGTVDLRCRLSAAVQKRRRNRWLQLDVRVGFEPPGGGSEFRSQRVFAPRMRH